MACFVGWKLGTTSVGLDVVRYSASCKVLVKIYEIIASLFGFFNINIYFCIRLRKVRAFSSAGLEHLPYKQRVGGSNPSTPTLRFG